MAFLNSFFSAYEEGGEPLRYVECRLTLTVRNSDLSNLPSFSIPPELERG